MRLIRYVFVWAVVGAWLLPGSARAQVEGRIYSLVYASENRAASQQWDYYQGAQFTLRPALDSPLAFKTHFRLARRGDPADWKERVYNAYLDFDAVGGDLRLRLGRQFLYHGVLNGSFDGLQVHAKPLPDLDVRLVGGVAAPYQRDLDVQSWQDGGMVGGYASYRFATEAKLDVSYIQRRRQDQVAWHQVGTALTGALERVLFYQFQFDYNLEKSTYQGMRYRLTYQPARWALFAEYNNQKPRIYEDSFFNIFELVAFNQIRGGATYQVGMYQLGAQLLHTIYEGDETNDEIIATASARWGTLGFVYQTGFGGDNVGVFGEVRYPILPSLEARLQSSHYTYQRRTIAIDEDATAFSGGLVFRPVKPLILQAELQQSLNSYYKHDFRALFRVNYAFTAR